MKSSNTSKRLKQLLVEQQLTQKDLLERCLPYCEMFNQKIDKSYISKWVNGEYEPNQIKLTILSLALNVSEVYPMGYDVPKERKIVNQQEKELIEKFNKLNKTGREKAMEYITDLTEQNKYIESDNLKIA